MEVTWDAFIYVFRFTFFNEKYWSVLEMLKISLKKIKLKTVLITSISILLKCQKI